MCRYLVTNMDECYFCGKPASPKHAFTQELYKIIQKTQEGFKFQQREVTIPQCEKCISDNDVQMSNRMIGSLPGLLWFLIQCLIYGIGYFAPIIARYVPRYFYPTYTNMFYAWVLLFGGNILGYGVSFIIRPSLWGRKKVKLHPGIAVLLENGWRLGSEPVEGEEVD